MNVPDPPGRVLPPVLAEAPVLVVQPHPDDAALSAFALLQRRAPTTVLTVFAGSPEPPVSTWWDQRLGFADSSATMRARLHEDDAAMVSLGVDRRRLPLLESTYRDRAPLVLEPLITEARAWAAAAGDRAVVALPVGAGGPLHMLAKLRYHLPLRPPLGLPGHGAPHPDHLAVTDALMPALAADGTTVCLYEELPYRWVGRGDARARSLTGLAASPLTVMDLPVSRAQKAAAVAHYRSQLPILFAPRWTARLEQVLPRTERYWLLSTPARG
jgi:LmbE family N-acetylglucosaminyl deacetylase